MQVKHFLVLLAMTIAGGAAADARFSTENQQRSSQFRLEYAQVQIDNLAQRDLRRMIYYADRATTTLQTMVEGADIRSISEQDKVNKRFRESIVRLADAGARSGLSMDQVADFYTQIVFDNFGQEFMQQVGTLAGGLDFRTLFRNVATVPDPASNSTDSGGSFLSDLADASQNLQLTTPFTENPQGVDPPSETDGPTSFPNANAIELNIVKRVQVLMAGGSLPSEPEILFPQSLRRFMAMRFPTPQFIAPIQRLFKTLT